MKINFNQLDRGYFRYKDEYDNVVVSVLESGQYVLGSQVSKFEDEFRHYIESDYCVGLNSGLDALILALRALGIGEGDEVIVPANTYIASVLAITENKATPIFVDPDEFYNIDTDKIIDKITTKTKAIMVVHLYGQSANMGKIKDIKEEYNLFLIEDCAQSHGSKFNGKTTGTFGDIGCFSFYPTKNIGAFGDGGAIVTNNKDIYEKIKMLRNYGSNVKYHNEILGINSRLDEIQAALLRVKLSHYSELLNERNNIVKYYLDNIKNPYIILPKIRLHADSVYHLFVIQTEQRHELQQFLNSFGIGTQIHYPIPPHLSQAYKHLGYKNNDLPITEKYANHILSLPLFDFMTIEEAAYVVEIINRFVRDE